jgi:hypothetical protein
VADIKLQKYILQAGAAMHLKDDDGMTAWDCIEKYSKDTQYIKIMRAVFEQYGG